MRNASAKRFARVLRTRATDAERHLWQRLRRRQLNGFRFRRQVPIGIYIVDFVCLEVRVVIELDGGQHADERRAYDQTRDQALSRMGYCTLRFWDNDVLARTDEVLERILEVLDAA